MLLTYDKETLVVTGAYDKVESIPEDLLYLDVSDDDYQLAICNFGSKIINGKVVPPVIMTDEKVFEDLKILKKLEIENSCAKEITNGTISNALGKEYFYPTKDTDQANLSASVLSSLLEANPEWTTPFWCRDDNGEWQYKWHTGLEIQQVGKDVKAMILAAQYKKVGYDKAIELAHTAKDLEAIFW